MVNFFNRALSFLKMFFLSKVPRNYKRVFDDIYEQGIWNDSDKTAPLSGPGSSIENTVDVSVLLGEFIYDKNIKSIADLGCGDLTWMSRTNFFNDKDISYIGIDVAGSLIEKHKKSYENKSFFNLDITADKLPNAELFIIRDVIFHLHLERIIKLFKNIKGKWKYLAITSCLNHVNNNKFDRWHFSERNLNIHPFNIKKNYLISITEEKFNRVFFIISHDAFYNQ